MPRPPRPWFRFYSETKESRKAQRLKPVLFKHWVNLLCLANVHTLRGRLPSLADVAYAFRPMTEAAVAAVMEELCSLGFIDHEGEGLVMHDWDEWQRESDANLTAGRRGRHAEGTPKERDRNATGPPKERRRNGVGTRRERIDQRREETDKETEAEADQIKLPLLKLAENSFGRMLSPMEIELLKALEEEHPYERIAYGFRVAAENAVRKMRYVQGVCEKEEQQGDSHERPGTGKANGLAEPPKSAFALYGQPEPKLILD